MRLRRVLIVGGILLGFLLGLAFLVATVLLGYRSPWRPTPKKLNQNVLHRTAPRNHAQVSSRHFVQNGAIPHGIAVAAQVVRSASDRGGVRAEQGSTRDV